MTITPFGESYFNEKATFFKGLDTETIKSGKVIIDGSKDNFISGVSTFSGTSISIDNGYLSSLNVSGVSTLSTANITQNLYVTGVSTFNNDLSVSGISTFNGDSIFTSKTQNVLGSPNTGAIQIDGGVGIEKNVSIGNSLDVAGNISQNKNKIRGFQSYAVLRDVKGATTDGGASSNTTWHQRTLNNESDPDGIVSLASNQFTLSAGSYLIQWFTAGYRCRRFSSTLTDTTNTTEYPGMLMYFDDQDSATNTISAGGVSTGVARVTLTASATFRIYSYSEFGIATNGSGLGHDSTGYNNVYTHVTIFKELEVY